MLSRSSRNTNVQEWKVIWVSIDNQMHFFKINFAKTFDIDLELFF